MSGNYRFKINHLNILIVCVVCFIFTNFPVRAFIIDDFSTVQSVPSNSSNSVTGPDMLGGERDINTESDRYTYGSADVNQTVSGRFYYGIDGTGLNYIHLVYDGIDGSSSRDYDGLGHIDLTDGGTCNGIMLDFTQVPAGLVSVVVTLYQGENTWGHASAVLQDDPQMVFIPFDEFTIDLWPASIPEKITANSDTLIDCTDVGCIDIELALWGGDESIAIDSVYTAYGVPEPMTMLLFGIGSIILRKESQGLRRKPN